MIGRLREAPVRASSLDARTAATKKVGEKTSEAVCVLTELALDQGMPAGAAEL